CQMAFPQGEHAQAALSSCEQSFCGSSCGLASTVCDSGLSFSSPACNSCLGTACCSQMEALASAGSAAQADYTICSQSPTSTQCTSDAVALAAYQCTDTSCRTQCGF
ncbi:MAG TPA: hypothetical protein VGM56_31220, partial [Byssovorax sp.]